MLRKYFSKLGQIYSEEGLIHTAKIFSKAIGEYILLELSNLKLANLSYSSRGIAELVTEIPWSKVTDEDLGRSRRQVNQEFLDNLDKI